MNQFKKEFIAFMFLIGSLFAGVYTLAIKTNELERKVMEERNIHFIDGDAEDHRYE